MSSYEFLSQYVQNSDTEATPHTLSLYGNENHRVTRSFLRSY
jgi:hypothetical protein